MIEELQIENARLREALAKAERRIEEQSDRIAELYLAQKSRFLQARDAGDK